MNTADKLDVKRRQIPYEWAQTVSIVVCYLVKYHAAEHGHERNEQTFQEVQPSVYEEGECEKEAGCVSQL